MLPVSCPSGAVSRYVLRGSNDRFRSSRADTLVDGAHQTGSIVGAGCGMMMAYRFPRKAP